MEIVEVLGYDGGKRSIKLNTLYEFRESHKSLKGKVIGELVRTTNPMENRLKLSTAGISREI